ncbi:MAG: lipopolysaccharide kinase [Frankiales bacterium]|nr:lipopolysaccharide kinase [Frankiales bacterium]
MALTVVGASGAALLDLPWSLPLERWPADRLVGLPRGVSRHVVRFVRVDGTAYAVKEIGTWSAHREYRLLQQMSREGVPCVVPVGVVDGRADDDGPLEPALVTRHLSFSLPYRALFSRRLRPETAGRLLDALAVLLVRLHLAGYWWGDCSLSNTLFRRDAGSFAAYLVDAETAEHHERLSPGRRADDLARARTNVVGELMDLQAGDLLEGADPVETGDLLCTRYQVLWAALTEREVVRAGERYRVDARIRRLNELGFDVAELEVRTGVDGDHLQIQPKVVDAGHHARRLLRLTGLDVEENQARRLLNDLDAYTADHAHADDADADPDEEVAAHDWLAEVFQPVVRAVPRELRGKLEQAQVFHEVLVHRWYLSEAAGRDVGIEVAARSYVDSVLRHRPDERALVDPLEA